MTKYEECRDRFLNCHREEYRELLAGAFEVAWDAALSEATGLMMDLGDTPESVEVFRRDKAFRDAVRNLHSWVKK